MTRLGRVVCQRMLWPFNSPRSPFLLLFLSPGCEGALQCQAGRIRECSPWLPLSMRAVKFVEDEATEVMVCAVIIGEIVCR